MIPTRQSDVYVDKLGFRFSGSSQEYRQILKYGTSIGVEFWQMEVQRNCHVLTQMKVV